MNSLILISPSKGSGFQPILSGKKTQKTANKNIEVGQKRYQQLLQNRLNSIEPEQ
jgi:hypothetical protein